MPKDAIASQEVKVGSAIIQNSAGTAGVVSGATLEVASSISAAELAADSVASSELAESLMGTGSPPAFGNSMLFGTETGMTGSPNLTGYIVFGNKFESAPKVIANMAGGADTLSVANVTTGSFEVTAATAATYSGACTWIAVGSGAW